jgi:uncharacterized protein (DUF488 family)
MTLYTIGYQKLTQAALIQELQLHKIDLLVDVRSKPYGRKVDFNKKRLEPALKEAGIEYAWEGKDLGGLSGQREPGYQERLKWLLQQAREKRVCVMCLEADPAKCHRGQWIAPDAEKQGVKVKHLPAPASTQLKLQ